jgi:hypothetical protein
MRWDTDSSLQIQGLGRTPDMTAEHAIRDIYETPIMLGNFVRAVSAAKRHNLLIAARLFLMVKIAASTGGKSYEQQVR